MQSQQVMFYGMKSLSWHLPVSSSPLWFSDLKSPVVEMMDHFWSEVTRSRQNKHLCTRCGQVMGFLLL